MKVKTVKKAKNEGNKVDVVNRVMEKWFKESPHLSAARELRELGVTTKDFHEFMRTHQLSRNAEDEVLGTLNSLDALERGFVK